MTQPHVWPRKTREFRNHHIDSTIWNEFKFRDDDIIISTWGKAGTTWMQQIVGQLVFGGTDDNVCKLSPWVDLRINPPNLLDLLESQTHRRFLKTHLAVDALVFSPRAKYIYVGRDGRDVVMSMYNHHASANQIWYDMLNKTPGLVGPPIERPTEDVRAYFDEWIERDGHPWWPFWENVRSWWEIRGLPNVLLVHYANLKRDMVGEIRRIAAFLEFHIEVEAWRGILGRCTFDYMKKNAKNVVPAEGVWLEGGPERFIHKGVNGQWRGVLNADDIAKYESAAAAKLTPDCAHWLATGELRGNRT